MSDWTAERLIAFEERVRIAFEAGEAKGPVHLSGGNEEQLIRIFAGINPTDWVFSTWRNHYHALLHGLPEDFVFDEILAGRSMQMNSIAHRFYTSAIVGGCLPIACGVAASLKRANSDMRVWCFVGDMAGSIGIFKDAHKYAIYNRLPITFVIEDNGYSTGTPTLEAWGKAPDGNNPYPAMEYKYTRTVPHYGSGKTRHL